MKYVAAFFGLTTLLALGSNQMLFLDAKDSRLDATLSNHANQLLKDEIRELTFKVQTTRTYDDGYRDATLASVRGTYTDGFTAAIKTAGDGGYAMGYHNALQQFGWEAVAASTPDVTTTSTSIESAPTTPESPGYPKAP